MENQESGMTGGSDSGSDMVPWLAGWRTSFLLGLLTLLLGVVVLARPTLSLTAIAILLGIAMMVSGVYHIVRALDSREQERVWSGIAGVLFLLAGLVLIRHLHLSVALIGLFIGFTWIIQGIASLMVSLSGASAGSRRGWAVFFGIISVIAGIVVVSAPIASVAALTIFMGIWLIVIGAVEMLGSVLYRRAAGKQPAEQVNVPEQRAGTASGDERAAAAGKDETASASGQPRSGADAGGQPKSGNVPR